MSDVQLIGTVSCPDCKKTHEMKVVDKSLQKVICECGRLLIGERQSFNSET